ncbi:energy transducer TonB [Bdellovibrionota bacterium FG-2]
MGVRTLRSSIGLSFVVHMLFIMVCATLVQKRATHQFSNDLRWVELDFTPPPVKEKIKQIQEASKEESKIRHQVVQTSIGERVEKALPDAFLGERNQRVVEEKVSKQKNILAGGAQAQSPQEAHQEVRPERFDKPLVGLGLRVIPSQKEIQEIEKARRDTTRWANFGSEALPQNAEDYVKGFKQSDKTALNTREYVFFGYFQRIRTRLDLAWVPILREKLVKLYHSGRQLASDMDHVTRVRVVLNNHGEIVKVQILGESGNHDLDEAATRAFRQAGPFPNPPKGIIDQKGEIEIPWEFILRT